MTILVGLIFTLICLFGGFMAMGGHPGVIWQPFEYVIICGSAGGTFIVANSMKTIKDSGKGMKEARKNAVPSRQDYLDVLGVLFSLMRALRGSSRNEMEEHIDNPAESSIFSAYPNIVNNKKFLRLSAITRASSSWAMHGPMKLKR